ncbi:MAG: hypothetical protein KDD58_13720 [Bdellovibrionales bacterium]|nr:hypothetical protein [Bdellovibrionales bacterium]
MESLKITIFNVLLLISICSQAKEIQHYDRYGNPTSCEIDSNGLEFTDGKCPSINLNLINYEDQFKCETESGGILEILVQHLRLTRIVVYAFGNVFTGAIDYPSTALLPTDFSVKTDQSELYEPETLNFFTNKFSQDPNKSLPNILTVYHNNGRAPWVSEITCKQIY